MDQRVAPVIREPEAHHGLVARERQVDEPPDPKLHPAAHERLGRARQTERQRPHLVDRDHARRRIVSARRSRLVRAYGPATRFSRGCDDVPTTGCTTSKTERAVARGHRALFRSSLRAGVGRTVILLGVVSLLTDISSEMVATVLPLYLIYNVGLSPLQFGVVNGIYQGGAAVVRVASGFFADRTRRHKEVALAGYGLSALCRPLLIVFGSVWGALAAVVFLDRTGKGIRTGPRDALISLSTKPERLGTAFGIHRALDTTGAMLGPLLAFGLLLLVPQGFNSVFVVSFVFAILGVAMLALFVRNPPRQASATAQQPKVTVAAAARLVGRGSFARLVVAASLVALFTISDGFVYLALQQRVDFDTGFFPLLYVATALVYMLLAVPVGALGDRVGRVRVFLGRLRCLARGLRRAPDRPRRSRNGRTGARSLRALLRGDRRSAGCDRERSLAGRPPGNRALDGHCGLGRHAARGLDRVRCPLDGDGRPHRGRLLRGRGPRPCSPSSPYWC